MGTVITKTERDILLEKISSRDIYEQLLDFLEHLNRKQPYISDEDLKCLSEKARTDISEGKGTSSDDMRKLHSTR